jgi:4-carboxymuconolactone decarboxylase
LTLAAALASCTRRAGSRGSDALVDPAPRGIRLSWPGSGSSRGQVGGPSKIWVHNPKLAKAAAPLGAHFHPGHYSLTEREREIAVCIINAKWHSAYPTSAHERRGKEVGLPADKVEALLAGLPTSFSDEREQIVYEMATALANSRWVPKGLYDRAVKTLGHVGITDVITLMGYYTSVSMTLAFYDVPAGATGMAR